MANGALNLGFVVNWSQRNTEVPRKVNDLMQGLQARQQFQTLQNRGQLGTFAAATATAAVAGFALKKSFDFARSGGELERNLMVAARTLGATESQFKEIEKAVFDIGTRLPVTAKQAAESLITLGQAGYDAQSGLNLLEPVQTLAVLSRGELDAAKSATVMNIVLRTFNKNASDAKTIVDQLAGATNAFALDFKELPLALGVAARGVGATGTTFEETLATLGAIKNIIPTTERAATAFATFNERLLNTKSLALLKSKGIDPINQSTGKFKDITTVMTDLFSTVEKMTPAAGRMFLQQVFGARAMAGVNAVMVQLGKETRVSNGQTLRGAELFKFWVSEAKKKGEAAALMAATMNNFAGAQDRASTAAQNFVTAIGRDFAGVLVKPLLVVAKVLEFMGNFWRSLPKPVRDVVSEMALVGTTILFITGTVRLLSVAWGVFKALTGATSFLGLILSPLSIALMAGVALLYAFKRATDLNIGGAGMKMMDFMRNVGTVIDGVFQMVSAGKITGDTAQKLVDDLGKGGGLLDTVLSIGGAIERVIHFFRGVGRGFDDIVSIMPGIRQLGDAFYELLDALGLMPKHDPEAAAGKWLAMGSAGEKVGRVLGMLADIIAKGLAFSMTTLSGIIVSMRQHWPDLKEAFAVVANRAGFLGEQFNNLLVSLGMMPSKQDKTRSTARSLGETIGNVLAGAIKFAAIALAAFIDVAAFATAVINFMVNAVRAADAGWRLMGLGIVDVVMTIGEWISGLADTISFEFDRSITKMKMGWLGLKALKADMMGDTVEARKHAMDLINMQADLTLREGVVKHRARERDNASDKRNAELFRLGEKADTYWDMAFGQGEGQSDAPKKMRRPKRFEAGTGGVDLMPAFAAQAQLNRSMNVEEWAAAVAQQNKSALEKANFNVNLVAKAEVDGQTLMTIHAKQAAIAGANDLTTMSGDDNPSTDH